jgi:hypothetical protein
LPEAELHTPPRIVISLVSIVGRPPSTITNFTNSGVSKLMYSFNGFTPISIHLLRILIVSQTSL